jgi:hypothetical protein
MRKYLTLAIVGALSFGLITNFATAGEETQTEVAKIKPKKLPKKKRKNIKLINTITTFNLPGTNQPPKGERTVLDLPKQFKFNTDKIKKCKTDQAGLGAAATTSDAVAACGKKSLVSDPKGSSAVVRVGTANPNDAATEIPVEVSAFNEQGKVLLLYSKPVGSFSGIPASILVGKLKKTSKIKGRPDEASKKLKRYKESLDVTIPPLAAGAIAFFEVTIKKSKYIQAKCKPKKMWWQATTFFGDAPSSSDTYSTKCKVKK